jgi:hypothetical protein
VSRDRARLLLPLLLVAGLALMLPFEYTVTRVLGIALMFAFIVVGVFAIATPEFLGGDDQDRGKRQG